MANNADHGSYVVKYTVTSNSSVSYVVSPRGPDDDVHRGAFAVPKAGTVSAMVSVASGPGQDFYVQPMARFLTWDGNIFNTISTQNMGLPVHLTGNGHWEKIVRQLSVPDGATHWYFDVAVHKANPQAPPDIGTVLYLDSAYVSENGMDLSNEPYLDGSQTGAQWDGTANDSTSVWSSDLPVEFPPVDSGDSGDFGNAGYDPIPWDPTEYPPYEPGPYDPYEGDPNPVDPGSTTPTDPLPLPEGPIEIPQVAEPVDPQTIAERLATNRGVGQLQLTGDIELGGFGFNRIDEQGVLWLVQDVENWWTIAEPDIPDYPRGLDDGSYETRGRYNARVFTIHGTFFPPSRSDVRPARDRLVRASSLCHYGEWFATHEEDATRASKVYLSGQPMINTTNVSGRTEFSIGLKAPDPVKYGLKDRRLPGWYSTTMSSRSALSGLGRSYGREYPWSYPVDESGAVVANEGTAENEGNIRVFPVFRLRGPTTGGLFITNLTTGQQMHVVRQLYDEEELVINCQDKTVTLNGALNQRFYLSIVTDWPYLDPGENKFVFRDEGEASRGVLTVEWRHGWIG